ncbi:unnamed protein product [Brachionus calyciflorus]|uniref:Uncharacterized protein n=1 Tax=Brachionus calyciflorus TaxID=104777 RepID=A0A813T173_9BILA|nr:unnamed protein product [Brachionus calyciflorus]
MAINYSRNDVLLAIGQLAKKALDYTETKIAAIISFKPLFDKIENDLKILIDHFQLSAEKNFNQENLNKIDQSAKSYLKEIIFINENLPRNPSKVTANIIDVRKQLEIQNRTHEAKLKIFQNNVRKKLIFSEIIFVVFLGFLFIKFSLTPSSLVKIGKYSIKAIYLIFLVILSERVCFFYFGKKIIRQQTSDIIETVDFFNEKIQLLDSLDQVFYRAKEKIYDYKSSLNPLVFDVGFLKRITVSESEMVICRCKQMIEAISKVHVQIRALSNENLRKWINENNIELIDY